MQEQKGVIDRFEDDYAVIEIGLETKNVSRELLPLEAKPGDVVIFTEQGIIIDYEQTRKKKNEVKKLMDDVWEE